MRTRPVAFVIFLAALCLSASALRAVEVPSPPPQSAEERAPYNDQIFLGGGGEGSNCCTGTSGNVSPQGQIGCDDPSCEQTVCNFDTFCCENNWDFICVAEARELCSICGGGTALSIPAATNWGLAALAGALLAGGLFLLTWRRRRTG